MGIYKYVLLNYYYLVLTVNYILYCDLIIVFFMFKILFAKELKQILYQNNSSNIASV